MATASFECPKCRAELAVNSEVVPLECSCPKCDAQLAAWFFPALFRERQTGPTATTLVDHTEASCFYHPQKQAAQVCDSCGRLICNLCSIDLGSQRLCPSCISAGRRKGKITALESSRTCYDRIALSMAVLGIFFWPLSSIMAPISLYLSIRHWNSPGSLLGVSKTRYVIAILIASLEILGWLTFILVLIYHAK